MNISKLIRENRVIVVVGSCVLLLVCAVVVIRYTFTSPKQDFVEDPLVAEDMRADMAGKGGSANGPDYESPTPPGPESTYQAPTMAEFPSVPETRSSTTLPHLFLSTLSFIAGGFSVYSILQTRAWHQKQQRDARRKEDLEAIRSALGAFHKKADHYPDASEGQFIEFLQSLGRSPADPLEGKKSSFKDVEFGYRYDNVVEPHPQNYEAAERSTGHFRLWCLLENEHDPDIDHFFDAQFRWVYMLTSEGNARNLP